MHNTNFNVFQFYRPPPGDPAGVVFQSTGQPMNAGEIVTATFQLGNTSYVRKRVTVLLHDGDFSDLSACTFWLRPFQAEATYTMRGFATAAWTTTTLSVYAATVGTEEWTRLDHVTMQRTPATATPGTECIEPAGSSANAASHAAQSTATTARPDRGVQPAVTAPVSPPAALIDSVQVASVDLRQAALATMSFESWLSATASGTVEVSLDGATWHSVANVPGDADWATIEIDLSAFASHVIYLRFSVDRNQSIGDAEHLWRIRHLRFTHR